MQIRFNPNMTEIVPKEQLDTEVNGAAITVKNVTRALWSDAIVSLQFGGNNNFKFDHNIYWRTLVQDCYLVSTPLSSMLGCVKPCQAGTRRWQARQAW
jgi:hypothetical protein